MSPATLRTLAFIARCAVIGLAAVGLLVGLFMRGNSEPEPRAARSRQK